MKIYHLQESTNIPRQAGGLNLFSYAGQSPVMNADPAGLQAVPLPIPGFAPPIVIPGARQNKSWNQLSQQAARNYCSVGAMTNGLFGVLCMTPQNPDDESKAISPEAIQGQVCKDANNNGSVWDDIEPNSPKNKIDLDEICYEQCKHLLPSPSGDL